MTEIHIDKLEHLYKIDNQVSLLKYDNKGKKLFEYSNPSFSGIYEVDVSDPYKVLLFYRDQQKIVFLDNTLSELSIKDLTHSENRYFSCLSRSIEGDLWAYEMNSQKLIKLSGEMEILDESFPLYQEGISGISPNFISVGIENVILGDPDLGVFLFDHLANYQKKLPIYSFSYLKNMGTKMLYYQDDGFYIYDKEVFEEKRILENLEDQKILFAINRREGQIVLFNDEAELKAYRKIGIK